MLGDADAWGAGAQGHTDEMGEGEGGRGIAEETGAQGTRGAEAITDGTMSVKSKLVTSMQFKLRDLSRAAKAGLADGTMLIEKFSLEEELSYLIAGPVPSKAECTRIRRKFGLMIGEFAEVPKPIVTAVPPMVAELKKATPVPTLPAHQPVVIANQSAPYKGRDRDRYLWERYCVHCDSRLEFGPHGYRCPSLMAHDSAQFITQEAVA